LLRFFATMTVSSILVVLFAASAESAAISAFLPPIGGAYASNADLQPAVTVSSAEECAAECLNTTIAPCISFNLCGSGSSFACGISGWSMAYGQASSSTCSWYRRSVPRNDAPVTQAVPWQLGVPTSGVALKSGPLAQAFNGNLQLYLKTRDPLDMLHFFAQRAGVANPPGECFGWDGWILGSAAGNFLMGAGNALRWADDAELRSNTEAVVNGIKGYAEPDGWAFAFNESDIVADNLPDYCASWVTRGLLDSAGAGVPGALTLARSMISNFNNHTLLPFILPPNGGPSPVQPFPSGFNNKTNGGYGQAAGHMIYIEYQGMIKHTLMALSGAGTQADVGIIHEHYEEDWWLQALLASDAYHAIWHRQFFSHNYEITAFEAFLDMYVLTGNVTYLTAVQNAWTMLREHWILPGGSFALNEGSYYPPDSFYIGFTGTHVSSHREHSHSDGGHGKNSSDPYYHAKCMINPLEGGGEHVSPLTSLRAAAMLGAPAAGGPNDGDPPTGELCGSVFWTKLNQRFHRLQPENETFVAEMERSILNVGVAAIGQAGSGGEGPNGFGIRYFANQHKVKQFPSMHASCCEGQGTRLFGSLPEYVYSTKADAVGVVTSLYVDLYADSNITFATGGGGASLVQDTAWPYSDSVTLTLTLPFSSALDLALRIPQWVTAPVVVTVSGVPWPISGTPASYLHLPRTWPAGATVLTFTLPKAFSAVRYVGSSQLPPYTRWAYLLGPVLMAAEGPWNATVDALVIPTAASLDPSMPAAWMQPQGDGNSLHYTIAGAPAFRFRPYFEVQAAGEQFSVYPCF